VGAGPARLRRARPAATLAGVGHVVGIAEESDGLFWSGRFSAERQGSECRGAERQGPQGVSADEAIAWARAHTGVVFIRPGGSSHYYSVGDEPGRAGRDRNTPPWHAGGRPLARRRMAGLEYLDRMALDPPISWEPTIATRLPSAAIEDAFLASLAAAVGALRVTREATAIRLAFEIEGRLIDEVRERAAASFKNALSVAVASGDVPAPFGWQISVSVEPAAAPSAGGAT
jgi:hypothetical protein